MSGETPARPRDIVIVGAGGFGREAADVIRAINAAQPGSWHLTGVYDDGPSAVNLQRLKDRGIDYLGPLPAGSRGKSLHYVVGIGHPQTRWAVADRCDRLGWNAATLIDPSAVIGSQTSIAPGSVICAGAVVSTNVSLGRHSHVNPRATIGHDSTLDSFVSVNPAATISGEVVVESEVLVGAGAVVLQGLRVGRAAVIGASACVVRDVPGGMTVKGVPAI